MNDAFPMRELAHTLSDELAREAHALFQHSRISTALWLLGALLVLWAIGAGLRALSSFSARVGLDRRRRVARAARTLQLVVALLAAAELLSSAAQIAPIWVASLVVFVLAPIVLLSSGALHDLLGGAVAQLRLHLSEGEYVEVAGQRGMVTRVGFTYLELRDDLGHMHRIPNRALSSATVEFAEERRAVPVDVTLVTSRALTFEEAERLSDGAATSPYRVRGTQVRVERLSPERVRVQFCVWSQAAVAPARRRAERVLAQLLTVHHD
jgi:small-conductance mechanosensitive channel